jgi:hypothetical protein
MITPLQSILKKIISNLDTITSVIGCIIGILILSLSLIGKINQFSIGFTIFIASGSYIFLKSRLNEDIIQNFTFSPRQKKILNILFFVLIIFVSIIWYNQLYSRPLEYFILLSLLSGLISLDIITYNEKYSVWPILGKIFLLALIFRAGIYYNFPSIMGYDAYFHTNIANLISTVGFIPPSEISDKYFSYPILHILISIIKNILLLDIKNSVFLSIGIISIFSLVFVFIFVNRIAGPRISLLSVLIISLSTHIISTGITNITAGSLVLCNFMVVLYFFMHQKWIPYFFTGLLIFLTATMILTHQLSSFVVLLSLFLLTISMLLYVYIFQIKFKNNFLFYLSFFAISMITYWMTTIANRQQSFFETVLEPLSDVLVYGGKYGSDILITGHVYTRPLNEILLLQISYLIIPFFAIGGIFLWLSKKDMNKISIALTAAVLFALIYIIPFLGIRNLLTDRWMPFLLIFLGILAAGYIIPSLEIIKSNFYRLSTFFIIIAVFSFIMITVPAINKDNPLVAKDTTVRNQYNFQEISAIEKLQKIHTEKILVDPSFIDPFHFYGSYSTIKEQKENLDTLFTFDTEDDLFEISKRSGILIVLRKSTSEEPISLKASNLYGDSYNAPLSKSTFQYFENSPNHNLIFTNGGIQAYKLK